MLATKTAFSPAPAQSPIKSLAKATAQCSNESRVYGACILANYQAVEKDMCKREFETFKKCVTQKVRVRRGVAKMKPPLLTLLDSSVASGNLTMSQNHRLNSSQLY